MKQAVIYFSLLLTALSFNSCSKDDNDDSKNDNAAKVAAFMTASTWKYSDAGLDINNDGVKDSNLPPGFTLASCETDNTITFRSDSTGVIDEGQTKCNTTSPQTMPFTWGLKNNGAEITFSAPLFVGLNGDLKIIEVSTTKFTLSKLVNTTYNGIPISANVIVFLTH
jgi:hypothetical protein